MARYERGTVLVLAIILLLVGGLIVASLLAHMSTGILTGEVYERRTAELYAADAGVEDALWKIQNGTTNLTVCYDELSYNISDVNDKLVEVTITLMTMVDDLPLDYRVVSTAAGDGSGTRVEAYVKGDIHYADYSGIMDHIITIAENLTDKQLADLINDLKNVSLACREGCAEECEDGCGAVYDYYAIPEGCYGCGAVYNYSDVIWPTPELLADWYWEDVTNETHYHGDTEIDLKGNSCPPGPIHVNGQPSDGWPSGLGPLYIDGDEVIVTITNSIDADPPPTLALNGTLYITGDTLIGQTDKDFTLDLNGQTVFVSSNHTQANDGKYALEIGGKCSIDGPGAVIAVGDIYFAPKGSVGSDGEPVFILSVSGKTQLQPSGDFYGAVAGSFDVELKPGEKPTLTYPPGGFGDLGINFPSLFEVNRLWSIASWEARPLSLEELGE